MDIKIQTKIIYSDCKEGEMPSSISSVLYILTPENGKILYNTKTKRKIDGCITVDSKKKADQYIEIER